MRHSVIRALTVIGAWIPVLLFWVLVSMINLRAPFTEVLPRAMLTIGTAAILGVIVWRLCARMPWPHEVKGSFYARHFVIGSLYAALWTVSGYAIETVLSGTPLWRTLFSSVAAGWQFIMGLWLYGVIAGISYSIQTQRRAHGNELRAIRAEAALTAARLEALRSRLDPHFLFNALHTVASLVREDAAQAENAVEKLGDMLRYTLRDGSGDTVSFADEWDFTRRYLEFEQLRYGERLRISVSIDPDCMSCTAPPFAMQTLVENAVHHSIATRPAGGLIEIAAHSGNGCLDVRVSDDGGNAPRTPNRGMGYGLYALRERLNAVYGERAHLEIAAERDRFQVSVSIPQHRMEDREEEPE